MSKTYAIDEIMAAFTRLKQTLDAEFGAGGGEQERFLIDEIATNVRNILMSEGSTTPSDVKDETYERELDDDETLFVGQNYNWFAGNGEW